MQGSPNYIESVNNHKRQLNIAKYQTQKAERNIRHVNSLIKTTPNWYYLKTNKRTEEERLVHYATADQAYLTFASDSKNASFVTQCVEFCLRQCYHTPAYTTNVNIIRIICVFIWWPKIKRRQEVMKRIYHLSQDVTFVQAQLSRKKVDCLGIPLHGTSCIVKL